MVELTDLPLDELKEQYLFSKSSLGKQMSKCRQLNEQVKRQALSGEPFNGLIQERKEARKICTELLSQHNSIVLALKEKKIYAGSQKR